MSDPKETNPGCGWVFMFALILITLGGIEISLGRAADALARIATAVEHAK